MTKKNKQEENKMIAIGSDHGGYALKEEIKAYLTDAGVQFEDCGCYSLDSVDYPDIAEAVCAKVTNGTCMRGILICGTGIGISIAANKVHGIRAALCHSEYDAKMCRKHNDANVMCLGGRTTGTALALEMVDAYLHTAFEGGRHSTRVGKIMAIEDK